MVELERENRVLKAMLAMTGQQRVVFRRLLTGPATVAEMADVLTAGRNIGCSDSCVRVHVRATACIADRFGFEVPRNCSGRRGVYVLHDRQI